VRIFAFILSFFIFSVFACDSGLETSFTPFAKEIKNDPSLKSYLIYFPTDDKAKNKMFFSDLSAHVDKLFLIELNYAESHEYLGYNSAMLSVNASIVDSVNIIGGYNANNKEKTSFSLCGNFKRYKLSDLLSAPKAVKKDKS
jgi:hypothetical protein